MNRTETLKIYTDARNAATGDDPDATARKALVWAGVRQAIADIRKEFSYNADALQIAKWLEGDLHAQAQHHVEDPK